MPELRALPPSQGEEIELGVRIGIGVMTNDPGCRMKGRTQAQISHLSCRTSVYGKNKRLPCVIFWWG